jgi:DNA-binding SARP family transcriptional activator
MTNGVELNVLGPLEVHVDGRSVAIPSGRLQALLAAFVLSEGRPVSVRTLADRLWSDEPPVRAGATMHTYVTRLRKLLGADVIHTMSGGYQFCVLHDYLEFGWGIFALCVKLLQRLSHLKFSVGKEQFC